MAEYDATDATLRRLARKRKMAELLQAQSMKGLELPNPNAPASYLNALGVLGEAYFGKKRGEEADVEDTKYEASQDEGRNKAIDSIKKFFGIGDEAGTTPAQPTTSNEPVSLRDSIESAMPKEQTAMDQLANAPGKEPSLGDMMLLDQGKSPNYAPPVTPQRGGPFAETPEKPLGEQLAGEPLDYKPNPKRTFGSEANNAIGQLANYPGKSPSLGDWLALDQTASPESPEMPKMLPGASPKTAPAPLVPKPVTPANVALPGNAFAADPTKGAFVNVSGSPAEQAKAHADIAAAMQKDKISGPIQYSPPPPGGGLPQATPPPPAALAAGAAPLAAPPAAPAAPLPAPAGPAPAAAPPAPAGGPIPLVPRTNPAVASAAPPVPKRPMVPSPVDFLTAIQQMPPGYAKNQMMEAAYKNVLTMPEKHDARLMHEETIRAQQALTAAMANARIQSSERNADVNAERARQTATITAAARGTMGTPSISKEDAERIAEQALTGDKSALTGLGYGGTGAANRAFVQSTMTRLAKERNMSGADVAAANANFASVMAGERAVGTRGAQVEMAVIEASKMATLVTQASENFSRTEFVPINKAISAFESNTGSVEVVQLGWAINSFINAYARAVSPVGVPPEKEREYARKLLSTATTHDQVVGSLAQLQKEMETAQAAPREVREQFRKEVGTVPPKRVTNDDEYNALEPGAVFIDPNGKQRQKPK